MFVCIILVLNCYISNMVVGVFGEARGAYSRPAPDLMVLESFLCTCRHPICHFITIYYTWQPTGRFPLEHAGNFPNNHQKTLVMSSIFSLPRQKNKSFIVASSFFINIVSDYEKSIVSHTTC